MEDLNGRSIFEEEVLNRFIEDNSYFKSAVPYIQPKYFADVGNSIVFDKMKSHFINAGRPPNLRELVILIKEEPQAQRETAIQALKKIRGTDNTERIGQDLLIEKTEEFIKKAIHTESLVKGAEGMGTNNQTLLAESFTLAEEAQKVSLDMDFGTSVFELEKCVTYYQDDTQGLVPPIPSFQNLMGRGFLPKTLHTFLAPPGIGKSATMSAFAVEFLKMGQDVVVFTLEMDEEEWLKRIYANLLDVPIRSLEYASLEELQIKFNKLVDKESYGTLTVKEFPSYAVTPIQIQNFLERYKTEFGTEKLVVFVDYLGLMSSARLPANTQSYEYIKSITAELRGVAQKLKIPMITAHQLNRGAVNNLEAGQDTVSDSAGISMFSDSMIFLLQTKEWKEEGKIRVNFEKNRMTGLTRHFDIGFDYEKMRFRDVFGEVTATNVNTGLEGLQRNPLKSVL